MHSHIYIITNLINNKIYIGKSNNPRLRWKDHIKISMGGKDKYPNDFFAIHAAISKHGIDNFKFDILEQFDTEEEAYKYETQLIILSCSNLKKFGYNCNLGGLGGIVPNEETRQKLIIFQNSPEQIMRQSKNMRQRHLDNPGFLGKINTGNQYTKGRKLSEDHKKKLSDHFTGRFVSEETRKKIGKDHAGEKSTSAKLTEKQVLEIREKYVPQKYGYVKLAREYNVNDETIRSIIKRKSWKYI